jgi:hypothetical protein
MNKRNRKKFNQRIDDNRHWLNTHATTTPWDKMYSEAKELLNSLSNSTSNMSIKAVVEFAMSTLFDGSYIFPFLR